MEFSHFEKKSHRDDIARAGRDAEPWRPRMAARLWAAWMPGLVEERVERGARPFAPGLPLGRRGCLEVQLEFGHLQDSLRLSCCRSPTNPAT
jgi:hypothetical protein